MSYIDFQQAHNIAHLILRDRLHERLRDPGPGDRFLIQGLNCAMIVAYCRPFSGNDRRAAVKIPDLPTRFLRVLTEEERWLHGSLAERPEAHQRTQQAGRRPDSIGQRSKLLTVLREFSLDFSAKSLDQF